MSLPRISSPLVSGLLPVLAILGVVALLYGHTLHAPWYLDDQSAINDNPLVVNFNLAWRQLMALRGVAILSFALNHALSGWSLVGFHLVNILIHAACGGLVLLLLRRVFPEAPYFPLLGALLFVAHPLQTEAVTYIVQRMTSLSALFFLLSLYLFVRSREFLASGVPFCRATHLAWYLGSLAAALLAFGSKENSVVLPLALLLFVVAFLPGERLRRPLLLALTPFGIASLLLCAAVLLGPLLRGGELATRTLGTLPLANLAGNTPWRYFVTELPVFWIYLRLILFPWGLALEHGYPLATSVLPVASLVAGAGLVLLGWGAWRLRRIRPRLAFGLAWFFLTLAVESSFIPLDPLFEHRLYLPLFGVLVILLDLGATLPRKAFLTTALLLLMLWGILTWQRNALWNDPAAFYAENVRLYPRSERAAVNYYSALYAAGRYAEAQRAAQQALALNPGSAMIYRDLARINLEQGQVDAALAMIEESLRRDERSAWSYNVLARVRMLQQRPDLARQAYLAALHREPSVATYLNAGVASEQLGFREEAESHYRAAAAMDPQDSRPPLYLARLLRARGRTLEALHAYRAALALAPQQNAVRAEAEGFARDNGLLLGP